MTDKKIITVRRDIEEVESLMLKARRNQEDVEKANNLLLQTADDVLDDFSMGGARKIVEKEDALLEKIDYYRKKALQELQNEEQLILEEYNRNEKMEDEKETCE